MITTWQGKCSVCGTTVRGGGEGFTPPEKGEKVYCIWCWCKHRKQR